MIRFKGWAITIEGEYPVVNTVKKRLSGKDEGKDVLTATYFPRDIKGAIEILYRISLVQASKEAKDLKELLEVIESNHNELMELVNGMKL